MQGKGGCDLWKRKWTFVSGTYIGGYKERTPGFFTTSALENDHCIAKIIFKSKRNCLGGGRGVKEKMAYSSSQVFLEAIVYGE